MYIHFPVIAVMTLFLGAFLIAIFGSKNDCVSRVLAMISVCASSALIFALFVPVILRGEVISYWMGNWSPVEDYAIGIGYEIDQLGLFFAFIVCLTMVLSTIYSLKYLKKDAGLDRYYTLYLMMSGAVLGLTLTGDVFNMFIMVEIMTFTVVGLIAFRNHSFGALEASFKYLVIGSIGSSLILCGIATLYCCCHTLNMAQIAAILADGLTPTAMFAFALMFTGFGIKAFIVPFHTPVCDSYMVSPTSMSMTLASMINKAGVYGMIRVAYTIFHCMDQNSIQILMVVLGAITMFVGVTMALAQHDFKRLLAFHSISQIGYVITAAGLATSLGLTAGLFHAVNHTLFKGLLFLCAGAVLTATGTTDLDKLGGLSKKMPKTTICFLIGAFSISGLPPFNGFASKWMVYQACYEKAVETGNFLYAFVTIVAVVVSVMTLASFIKVTQAVFFGQCPASLADTKEVSLSMRLPMWIMSAFCVFFGVAYNIVNKYLLSPAVNASFNVGNYIDRMMGSGYAQAHGFVQGAVGEASFSYWNPVVWLLLFAIVLLAVFIVMLTGGNERGQVLTNTEELVDGKYATFFGGEKALPSHVGGSDLFWGFKKDWRKYFEVAQGLHSGIVNDYASWVVAGLAVILIFVFAFVR